MTLPGNLNSNWPRSLAPGSCQWLSVCPSGHTARSSWPTGTGPSHGKSSRCGSAVAVANRKPGFEPCSGLNLKLCLRGHCGASVVAQTGLAAPVLLVNAPRVADPCPDVDAAQRRFRWLSLRISAAEVLPARKDPTAMRSACAESGRVTNDAPRTHAAGKKHAGLLTPRSQVHVAPPINPDNDHRQSGSQYAMQGIGLIWRTQ